MNTSNCYYRQLTLAREYRGYSQSELSKAVDGLSQPNLSKFEKGLGGLSDEALSNVMSFLKFPDSFLKERITNKIENAEYRKRTTITKKKKLSFETNIKLIGFIIDKMSDSIEWPEFNLTPFDLEEGYSPEYVAKFTRNRLNIDFADPIMNINTLLEKNGVIVVEFDPNSDKFDGVSFITDMGSPVIIINSKFSNDRKRFTLAHELGHIIMHLSGAPIPEYRDKEMEANMFASEFLMPEEAIHNSLRNLKLAYLGELKRYWLTSMASIIMRAKNLGCITKERYRYLYIEFSRSGQKKKESFDVPIDSPKLFKIGYQMHKDDLNYDRDDFVNAFSLPIDVIDSFFSENTNRAKLKILA